MKKVVISFFVGFLLAVGASAAYAEVQSLIGRKIDGQFPLKVGNKLSDIPAITIDGVSYIPLRAAGELFGAKVAWLDGEIIMEPNQESVIREDLQELARQQQEEFDRKAREESERLNNYARKRNEITTKIDNLKVSIMQKQWDINSKKNEIEKIGSRKKNPPQEILSLYRVTRYEDTPVYQQDLERIAQLKSEIETIQSEISDLEAQLAELEAQLAELEKNKPEELQ